MFLCVGAAQAAVPTISPSSWAITVKGYNQSGAFFAPTGVTLAITKQSGSLIYGTLSMPGKTAGTIDRNPFCGLIEGTTTFTIRATVGKSMVFGTLGGLSGGVYRSIINLSVMTPAIGSSLEQNLLAGVATRR